MPLRLHPLNIGSIRNNNARLTQMQTYSSIEIAENHHLWAEYVDPLGLDDKEAFDAMTTEKKLEIMEDCFSVH